MAYNVEKIPGEPVVLATLYESFDMAHDAVPATDEVTAILDAQSSPIYYIADMRMVKVSFGDMVSQMGFFTKGSTAYLKHPNLKELVVITSSDLLVMGAKALGQRQYGGLAVSVFGSLEEAFDYMREHSAPY